MFPFHPKCPYSAAVKGRFHTQLSSVCFTTETKCTDFLKDKQLTPLKKQQVRSWQEGLLGEDDCLQALQPEFRALLSQPLGGGGWCLKLKANLDYTASPAQVSGWRRVI